MRLVRFGEGCQVPGALCPVDIAVQCIVDRLARFFGRREKGGNWAGIGQVLSALWARPFPLFFQGGVV